MFTHVKKRFRKKQPSQFVRGFVSLLPSRRLMPEQRRHWFLSPLTEMLASHSSLEDYNKRQEALPGLLNTGAASDAFSWRHLVAGRLLAKGDAIWSCMEYHYLSECRGRFQFDLAWSGRREKLVARTRNTRHPARPRAAAQLMATPSR